MNANVVTIPLMLAAVIGAVYLGALELVLSLRQSYLVSSAGQTASGPQLASNPIVLPAVIVGIFLIVLVAAFFLSMKGKTVPDAAEVKSP